MAYREQGLVVWEQDRGVRITVSSLSARVANSLATVLALVQKLLCFFEPEDPFAQSGERHGRRVLLSLFSPFSTIQSQTASTTAVQIAFPVLVTDSSGRSIHGLQKSDFDIRLAKNGSLESVDGVPVLSFSGFADPVPVFILFDELSIYRNRQIDLSRLLLNYLHKAADDHMAVTLLVNTLNGVRVIHDMTTEMKVFGAAMDRVSAPNGTSPPTTGSGEPQEFELAVRDEVA